ncbi:hypothetical protein PDN92_30115, partial [Escherichia coli]|uniref:hypothetical protein n=1 Tax=Escherichia coli TaxID=562 RepID=UPI0022F2606F
MLPSETMIWQPEFTDKTLSRKPGAVQSDATGTDSTGLGDFFGDNPLATRRIRGICLYIIRSGASPIFF